MAINTAVVTFMRLYLKVPNISVKDQFRKVTGIKTRFKNFPPKSEERSVLFANDACVAKIFSIIKIREIAQNNFQNVNNLLPRVTLNFEITLNINP